MRSFLCYLILALISTRIPTIKSIRHKGAVPPPKDAARVAIQTKSPLANISMDLESLPEIRRITFAEGMMRGTKVSCTNAFSYGVDDNLIY